MAKKPKTGAKKLPNCKDIWFDLTLPRLNTPIEEKRKLWSVCGSWVMQQWMGSRDYPGQRPHCYWEFDAPEKRDFSIDESDQLAKLNLLQNWERDQLLEWEMLRGQPDSDED